MGWRREEPADFETLRKLAHEVRQTFPLLDCSRDLEWVAVDHGWPRKELAILVERLDEKVVGFAALPVTDESIVASLGPLRLFHTVARQHRLIQDVAIAGAASAASILGYLRQLSMLVKADGVLLVSAVPVNSTLYETLVTPPREQRLPFRVLRLGGHKLNCRIAWSGSFEAYLASLGKVSRKELRRNARALLGDVALACDVRVYRTPDEAETFLQDAAGVSAKTYQRRTLGLGVFAGGNAERTIRFAASVGALRACVLYINGSPVAFEYGFVWAGVCIMKQAGYDPAWAARQVGSVLFAEFIRGCELEQRPIRLFDLMPGVSLFKLRTTNEKVPIQHFLLFPLSAIGTARYFAMRSVFALSSIGRLLIRRRTDLGTKYRESANAQQAP